MSTAQLVAEIVLGSIAWVGLALCVAVAVGRTIRERDRHADDRRGAFLDPVAGASPERVGTRLDQWL